MGPIEEFERECRKEVASLGLDSAVLKLSMQWFQSVNLMKYSYHFKMHGLPIIQYPQDIVALQELIWEVKPDVIIETGIARGGSLVMSAGQLALLDYCEAERTTGRLNIQESRKRVIGIDIDIREHNRRAIENHPLRHKIEMIQGSSIDPNTIEDVWMRIAPHEKVMVILDSNHTHEHVLAELEAYGPLVSKGSYCIVFDTIIEDMKETPFSDRPWGIGDNPKTAVHEYLRRIEGGDKLGLDGSRLLFTIDRQIQHKLLVTVAPDGYLRRLS